MPKTRASRSPAARGNDAPRYRTCGSSARSQYATAMAPPSGVPIARSP
ncbi:hypothetical protein BURMUCF2_B0641, partial [Burkholderia multivorans CF2]